MTSLIFPVDVSTKLSDVAVTIGANQQRRHTPEAPSGYACIRVSGDDAKTFLQGQLTIDVMALSVGQCQTAALCDPKGRVVAQFELAHLEEHTFAIILPAALITNVIQTLSRYILRSKVSIETWSEQPSITLQKMEDAPDPGQCRLLDTQLQCRPSWLPANDPQWVMTNAPLDTDEVDATDLDWAYAHVLFGIAPPLLTTTLEHIPQMLNLDVLNAVSVTKGCYTGQEIVARVHYRGAVKRRLRRFIVNSDQAIVPGDPVHTPEHSVCGMVTEIATDRNNHLGLLAVIKESAFSQHATLSCGGNELTHWPLPYSLESTG